MKIKSNFKWDMKHLEDNMKAMWKKAMESSKGYPYGFVMHPETLYSMISSDEYFEHYRFHFNDHGMIFGFKVVGDIDMQEGEWNLLISSNIGEKD